MSKYEREKVKFLRRKLGYARSKKRQIKNYANIKGHFNLEDLVNDENLKGTELKIKQKMIEARKKEI